MLLTVPLLICSGIEIIHAIQFATMDHIQENRVAAMQDGREAVATTVSTSLESFVLKLK